MPTDESWKKRYQKLKGKVEELEAEADFWADVKNGYNKDHSGCVSILQHKSLIYKAQKMERVVKTGVAYYKLWIPDTKNQDELQCRFSDLMQAISEMGDLK